MNNIVRILKTLKKERRGQILVLLVLVVVASIAETLSIASIIPFVAVLTSPELIFNHELSKPVIQFFGISNPSQIQSPLTIIFVIIVLLSSLIRMLLVWYQTKLAHRIGVDLGVRAYNNALYQSYEEHISKNSSGIISIISTKINRIMRQVLQPALNTVSSIIILIPILILLLSLNSIVVLISFLVVVLLYGLMVFISKKILRKNGLIVSCETTRVVKLLRESLDGMRDVLINNNQNLYSSKFKISDTNLKDAQAKNTIISLMPRYIVESISMVGIALIAFILITGGDDQYGMSIFGAFVMGAQKSLPLFQQLFSNWSQIKSGEKDTEELLELVESGPFSRSKYKSGGMLEFKEKIVFNNISYRYNSKSSYVLNNVCLTISKGDKVGIIGETGSGKSTLIDILMGLLLPTKGELVVDNSSINYDSNRAWMANISHVPQKVFLLDDTVEENIAFGSNINFQHVRNAATKARISEVVEKMPEQYKTSIGEDGVFLSGGQRQRIALARVFYRNKGVIVLDEATSALDEKTEQMVIDNIEKIGHNPTVFMVTHRVSTLKNCDYIIEVAKGNIIKYGSYSELVVSKDEESH